MNSSSGSALACVGRHRLLEEFENQVMEMGLIAPGPAATITFPGLMHKGACSLLSKAL